MAERRFWFFGAGQSTSALKSRARLRSVGRTIEQLESRDLMHGVGLDQSSPPLSLSTGAAPYAIVQPFDHSFGQPGGVSGGNSAGSPFGSVVSSAVLNSVRSPIVITDPVRDQQMGTPLLDSNPGAPATLYLDFNGNFESDWFTVDANGNQQHFKNVSTPTFDTDGDPNTFSAAEKATIKEIWQRVSEDYAPFNINVSTDYYGSFNNGQALHVVIGGSNNDWLKQDASGFSSIGSFHDIAPNTVFVFDLMAWAKAGVTDSEGHPLNGPAAIATTASHEAGHAFGLFHHSVYNFDGDKLEEYDPGTSAWTPIMGNNKASDRTTWDAGPTDQGPNSNQIDMDVIGGSANGFGFRADDHGDTTANADPLTSGLSIIQPLTGHGIVGNMHDVDAFKFTTTAGYVQIHVYAAAVGPNLMPVAQLWSNNGFVANANAGSMTESIITVNVPAGTYYVFVKSFGDYGDVGQYTLSVTTPIMAQSTTMLTASSANAFYQPPTDALNPATVGTYTMAVPPVKTIATAGSAKGAGSSGAPEGLANLLLSTLLPSSKRTDQKSLLPIGGLSPAICDAVFREFGVA